MTTAGAGSSVPCSKAAAVSHSKMGFCISDGFLGRGSSLWGVIGVPPPFLLMTPWVPCRDRSDMKPLRVPIVVELVAYMSLTVRG